MKYINRLSADELAWELRVRGRKPEGKNVDERRAELRAALRAESLDPRVTATYPELGIDMEVLFKTCIDQFATLQPRLDLFYDDPNTNEGESLSAKLNHILGKLTICVPKVSSLDEGNRVQGMQTQLVKVIEKVDSIMQSPHAKANDLAIELKNLTPDQVVNQLSPQVLDAIRQPAATLNPSVMSVPTNYSLNVQPNAVVAQNNDPNQYDQMPTPTAANLNMMQPRTMFKEPLPYYRHKPDAISRWNLKFSGSNDVATVISFLERVEELKTSREVSDELLFQSAFDLFEGDALVWCRATKPTVSNWIELVAELKYYYLPIDYDDAIWEEIRNRTQGYDEQAFIYVSHLRRLFSRLTHVPSEDEQVKLMKKNLQPRYHIQLAFQSINSIKSLMEACKLISEEERHSKNFKGETSSKVEPAATSVKAEIHAMPSNSWRGSYYSRNYHRTPPAHTHCFNCKKSGHFYQRCPSTERNLFCYVCGTQDVTYINCPKCSKNAERRE